VSSATMWRKRITLLTWYSKAQALVQEHFPAISMYCIRQPDKLYIQGICTISSAFNALNLQTQANDWNCHWSNVKPQMIRNILHTTEAHSNHEWVTNTGNSHLQDDPHRTSQKHFQHPSSVNVSTGVIHDQHNAFHTFPHPTGDIYANTL